jgi:hypothetical protein
MTAANVANSCRGNTGAGASANRFRSRGSAAATNAVGSGNGREGDLASATARTGASVSFRLLVMVAMLGTLGVGASLLASLEAEPNKRPATSVMRLAFPVEECHTRSSDQRWLL